MERNPSNDITPLSSEENTTVSSPIKHFTKKENEVDSVRMNLLTKENKKMKKNIKELRKWLKEVSKDHKNKLELKTIGSQSENLL